ncbi:MAG: zinc-binding dehydrogenase [bacterium]|jgi:threonine dehydrogenase-like Zn-dependent dehydrogenase|nr:zinc-binding dehydrogenase [Bacillota bacterium]
MIRAAVLEKPLEPLQVKGFPEPKMEPGSILLKTVLSEVCGTDVHLFHGRLGECPYPIIPGHINVGIIEHIEGEVRDIDGVPFRTGELVTFLDVHNTCNNCWFCLVAKATTRCPHRKVYGITYSAAEGLLGGWSQYIYLKPGTKIVRLPAGVSPERFIGGGCGLPTAFHAVERAGIFIGDSVVVQGSGPVGLSASILARLAGALQVILVGGPRHRLELGLAMGADAVINIDDTTPQERLERILALTGGRGADVTIEATGVPAALKEGMAFTRDNGTYVVVGQYTDNGTLEVNPHWEINKKHLDIRGTWGIDFSHFYRSIQVLEHYGSQYPWERFISREYSLAEVNQAIQDVEAQRVIKAVINPWA